MGFTLKNEVQLSPKNRRQSWDFGNYPFRNEDEGYEARNINQAFIRWLKCQILLKRKALLDDVIRAVVQHHIKTILSFRDCRGICKKTFNKQIQWKF